MAISFYMRFGITTLTAPEGGDRHEATQESEKILSVLQETHHP